MINTADIYTPALARLNENQNNWQNQLRSVGLSSAPAPDQQQGDKKASDLDTIADVNLEQYEIAGKDQFNYGKNNVQIKNDASSNIFYNSDFYKAIRQGNNLFSHSEIDLYRYHYRFGLMNPYDTVTTVREYLFFTKPDLHILNMNGEKEGSYVSKTIQSDSELNPELEDDVYWCNLVENQKYLVGMLQDTFGQTLYGGDRFNHLLESSCISNLEVPSLTSEMVDTPVNMYGVGYSYRGSSEDSDDGPEFSLEFRDTRDLDVFNFFKFYEDYETLKSHGTVSPWRGYICNKELHDAFAIYKFIVDEDMETIIYYGKMYGVTPTSLPRDSFSTTTMDNGLSYSINFKAAWYDDMKQYILADFNNLSKPYAMGLPYGIDIYNQRLGHVDTRPGMGAYVESVYNPYGPPKFKLKWRTA